MHHSFLGLGSILGIPFPSSHLRFLSGMAFSSSSSPSRAEGKAPVTTSPVGEVAASGSKRRRLVPIDRTRFYDEDFHIRGGSEEWEWYPDMLRKWVREERVPPPPKAGESSTESTLPPLYHPFEQSFAAFIARTDREFHNMRSAASELTNLLQSDLYLTKTMKEVLADLRELKEVNAQLMDRVGELEFANDDLREEVYEARGAAQAAEERAALIENAFHEAHAPAEPEEEEEPEAEENPEEEEVSEVSSAGSANGH